MADYKIRYDDIFEGDLFKEMKKSLDELTEKLTKFDNLLKENSQNYKKSINEIISSNDSNSKKLEQVNKNVVELTKNYKEQAEILKVTAKIKEIENLVDKTAVELTENKRFAKRELTKDIREELKVTKALNEIQKDERIILEAIARDYNTLQDTLEGLRVRYRNLAAAGKENTEEAKNLLASIQKLDDRIKEIDYSIGVYHRNVGNYLGSMKVFWNETIEKASQTRGVLGTLIQTLNGVRIAFNAAGGGLKGFASGLKFLGRMILAGGIIGAINLLGDLLDRLWSGLKNIVTSYFSTTGKTPVDITATEQETLDYLQSIENDPRLSDEEKLKKFKEFYKKYSDTQNLLLKQREYYINEKRKLEEKNRKLQDEIIRKKAKYPPVDGVAPKLPEEEEFEENQKLIIKYQEYINAYQYGADKIDVALRTTNEKTEELAKKIAADKEREIAQAIEEKTERLNDIITDIFKLNKKFKVIFEKVHNDFIEEITNIDKAYFEASKLAQELGRNVEDITKLYNAKTIEIINNTIDELTVAVNSYMNKYKDLKEKLYESLPDMLMEKIKLKTLSTVNDIQSQINDLLIGIEKIDLEINKLRLKYSQISSEVEKNEILKSIELLEKERSRIESLIAENIILKEEIEIWGKYELVKQRLDLMKGEYEKERTWIELQFEKNKKFYDDEKKWQEDKQKALIQLEKNYYYDMLNIVSQNLEEFKKLKSEKPDEYKIFDIIITNLEKTSLDIEKKFEEINNKLAEERKKTNEEIRKSLEQQIKANSKYITELLGYLNKYAENIAKTKQEILNKRLSEIDKQISALTAKIEGGNVYADESLAKLESKRRELIKQQEEIKKEAQRRELALSAFSAYAQGIAQGKTPQQSLIETLKALSQLTSFVSTLPTFKEGTEYVDSKLINLPFKEDAILARIHVGERIVPADINKKLGDIPNDKLPELINNSEKVLFDYDSLLDSLTLAIKRRNEIRKIKRLL